MFKTLPVHLVLGLLLVTPAFSQCIGGQCMPGGWQPVRPGAGATVPQKPHPAVCRIANKTLLGTSFGSGTLVVVGNLRLVLTCAHLFQAGQGEITAKFPESTLLQATVLGIDRANDLAMLLVSTTDIQPVNVFANETRGNLRACGYGGDGQYGCIQGAVIGYSTPISTTYPSIKIRGAVRRGDSGGPVFNVQNELVGVIWGVRDGLTYATFGQPLQQFLDRITSSHDRVKVQPVQPKQEPVKPIPKAPSNDSQLAKWNSRFDKIEQLLNERSNISAGLSTGRIIVATLGLSGPVAMAVLLGSLLMRRRVSKRLAPTRSRPRQTIHPVSVDSPPLPQQTVPETHYVPYERNEFSQAYQWASEQVSRKYPGAVEILTTLDSLIKQQMNAKS